MKDDERETGLQRLRAELQIGIDQLAAGQKSVLDIEAIKAAGRLRLAKAAAVRRHPADPVRSPERE